MSSDYVLFGYGFGIRLRGQVGWVGFSPHAVSLEFDAVRVVDDPAEDGVGDGWRCYDRPMICLNRPLLRRRRSERLQQLKWALTVRERISSVFDDSSLLGRSVYRLARSMAIAGGVVLICLLLVVVVSVTGRALLWAGLRPIRGDYEIVEAGVGFAVFAFLPWAHLERGHAVVTILSDRFGPLVNRWILVATDLMMLAAAGFIAWRLYHGMLDKFAFGETTLLLRMPLGWPYMAALVGAVVFVIVSVYVFGRSLTNALAGRDEQARREAEV